MIPTTSPTRKSGRLGRCCLCHSRDWLVDSHIIPDFHYKPLKQSEGQFYILSTDPAKRKIKRQKGITEALLCARCDNGRLSKYESHLAQVLFHGGSLKANQRGSLLVFEGYNYKQIKNGLLSILWRMSLSTNPFFQKVDLGEKHQERLRIGLLNDITFPEEEYPILAVAPSFDGKVLTDAILMPDLMHVDGNRVYRCLISGLIFTFTVGAIPLVETGQALILREKLWPIGTAKIQDIPFLYEAALRYGSANYMRAT